MEHPGQGDEVMGEGRREQRKKKGDPKRGSLGAYKRLTQSPRDSLPALETPAFSTENILPFAFCPGKELFDLSKPPGVQLFLCLREEPGLLAAAPWHRHL